MTKIIDREIFFGNPEIAGGQLSPDGKYVSFLKAYDGIMNLYVKEFSDTFEDAWLLTESKSPILGYFWTADSKNILYVNDKGGDENINIFKVSPFKTGSTPKSVNLTPLKEVTAQIYKVSRQKPGFMWLGLNDRDKAWHDLYTLDANTGELTLLYENKERITGWNLDWDEQIRLAFRTDENGHSEILRVEDFNTLILIYKTNLQESTGVIQWDKENENPYIISNKGDVDLLTLYSLDIKNGQTTKIESDPENKVDISDVFIHRHTREIINTVYENEKNKIYWKNSEWEEMYNSLKGKFSGREVNIVSATDDYQQMLISVSGDKYATSVYYFDRSNKGIIPQYTLRTDLKKVEDQLSHMTPISYKSSDGLEIPAYLTLPIGVENHTNLPCVVFVHGGPKGPRDSWCYRGDVQFLANRGYAVLQPNFRASGGYGKAFLNAGDKQWGRLMQDDITWGVKHLVDHGIIDEKRVGILGGSYGGYATLAGLAFTPDLYACGVDIVGPSNLFTLLDSIPAYWESGRKWLYEMTGDPETKEGQELIRNASPLFHIDNMKKPLLIVQGANDPRVKQAESDQIVAALKSKGHDVRYLLAEDEGHGFRKPLNKIAMWSEVERFFAKHLGGQYQTDIRPEIKNALEILVQD